MSAKAGIPCALLLTVVVAGASRCQQPTRAEPPGGYPPPAAAAPAPDAVPAPPPVPDPYILREIPGCCGPVGKCGPITYELYLRTGVSLPTYGTGGLANTVGAGWVIQGGGRSLFFNPAMTSAWTADLSVSNIYNHGNQPGWVYPFKGAILDPANPGPIVSTAAINRTFFNVAVGKEWYLLGPANNCNWNWRVGTDGGGQLGTMRLDMVDPSQASGYRRGNDVIGGMFCSLHTDVEIPFKSCVLLAGFRAEWGYTWSDIVESINSDMMNVNLLYTGGIRY